MMSRIIVVMLLVACAAACKRAPDAGDLGKDAAELSDAELRKLVEEQRVQIAEPVTDVAVSAYIDGRNLHVAVKNQTQKSLIIGPKNMAILMPGGGIVRFKAQEAGFPIAKLLAGDRAEGLLPLNGLKPAQLSGAKFIFRHPDVKDATTPVRASASEPLKTPSIPVEPAKQP